MGFRACWRSGRFLGLCRRNLCNKSKSRFSRNFRRNSLLLPHYRKAYSLSISFLERPIGRRGWEIDKYYRLLSSL
nr:MAG TPA: hypothetical protein [Caudoviricetes sp.]